QPDRIMKKELIRTPTTVKMAGSGSRSCSSSALHRPERLTAGSLMAVAMGFVMALLDVTIVNVAATHIQSGLAMGLTGLMWVVDGYTLTFAALLLAGGGLANRYGARRLYLSGLMIFIIASVSCGLAATTAPLVVARLLQGVGAALFMPASLSLLAQAYQDEKLRTRALSIWAATVAAAGAI